MDIIGIICEYNPFHNGHLYHLNKIKEMYKDSTIILILSGNFTERGHLSILNKWEKTEIALEFGVDLVIELPFIFATQSADIFARGAINILKLLNVEKLVFGSESNDIKNLINIANIQLNNKEYDNLVKKYLDEGVNYPTALSMALKDINNSTVTLPNDLLGLSYVKEIIKQEANIEAISIKRTNDFHGENLDGKIVSASAIRNNLDSKLVKNCVPNIVYNKLQKIDKNINDNYFSFLKYKIISEVTNIKRYQTVDEGIENRILKNINSSTTIEELIKNIKTKRYTYNKLTRMFTHIVCSFTKEEAKDISTRYIRVLGFSNKGLKHLNKIKKELDIPIITNYKKEYSELLKIDNRIDNIYNLITNEKKEEYKRKPVIKK